MRTSPPRLAAALIIVLATLVDLARAQGDKHAPDVGGIRCVSTMTRPDQELICPEFRNKWCVKVVSSLDESECGRGEYFGDTYQTEPEPDCVSGVPGVVATLTFSTLFEGRVLRASGWWTIPRLPPLSFRSWTTSQPLWRKKLGIVSGWLPYLTCIDLR